MVPALFRWASCLSSLNVLVGSGFFLFEPKTEDGCCLLFLFFFRRLAACVLECIAHQGALSNVQSIFERESELATDREGKGKRRAGSCELFARFDCDTHYVGERRFESRRRWPPMALKKTNGTEQAEERSTLLGAFGAEKPHRIPG